MQKPQLRKHYKEIRAKQNIENIEILLSNNFLQNVKLKSSAKIASYYPINSEADISHLNAILLDLGHEVFLPCEDFKLRLLEGELKQGKFPEPVASEVIPTAEIDIFIIPLVAFDENKNRLGYGGGYYDRLLENSSAQKIGIAYEAQKADKLPTEKHDIKLDMIITEANIYK